MPTFGLEGREAALDIPVFGPIFPRANMMTEMSGATSADMLKRDIILGLPNPSVHAIMMLAYRGSRELLGSSPA